MKMNNFIPQMEPWFDIEERQAMNSYLSEGGWITEFRKTQEFEDSFKLAKKRILKEQSFLIITHNDVDGFSSAGILDNLFHELGKKYKINRLDENNMIVPDEK